MALPGGVPPRRFPAGIGRLTRGGIYASASVRTTDRAGGQTGLRPSERRCASSARHGSGDRQGRGNAGSRAVDTLDLEAPTQQIRTLAQAPKAESPVGRLDIEA